MVLRNQIKPIKTLASAAEAFGKGQSLSYKPTGSIEIRKAGSAFLEMRKRLERQIEQRTQMLSGVSHDLRTPLTRLKLALALKEEDAEAKEMLNDIQLMQNILDEFLEFSKKNHNSGFVSSGSTAAIMVLSRLHMGMIEGIDRPAICSLIPNKKNYSLMLDLGANVIVSGSNLFQFALMGFCYFSIIFC